MSIFVQGAFHFELSQKYRVLVLSVSRQQLVTMITSVLALFQTCIMSKYRAYLY